MKNIELAITMKVMELKTCTQQELSMEFGSSTIARYMGGLVDAKVLHSWNKGYSRDNGTFGYTKMYEIHNEYHKKFKEKYLTNKATGMDEEEKKMVVKFHSQHPAHFEINGTNYEYVPGWGLMYQGKQLKTHKQWAKDVKKAIAKGKPQGKGMLIRDVEDPELRKEIKGVVEDLKNQWDVPLFKEK